MRELNIYVYILYRRSRELFRSNNFAVEVREQSVPILYVFEWRKIRWTQAHVKHENFIDN